MARKIFVSYKYHDENVQQMYNGIFPIYTKVRDYVDILEQKIGKDNIYKGEQDGEDLSRLSSVAIWERLKPKIFDSSITVVLISPGMKEKFFKLEKHQWIHQEISYSLKNITRKDKSSRANGVICVVLPDRTGRYDYYLKESYYGEIYYKNEVTFSIIAQNQNNKKYTKGSYIVTVKWDEFIRNMEKYFDEAIQHRDNIDEYNIVKEV